MPSVVIDKSHKIYYQTITGKANLPYLIFLHEGLGCTAMWGDFPALLCQQTGCSGLMYDRQGYGLSSPFTTPRTVNYLHHSALQELPAVIEKLIPESPYILIGHSDGGTIALIHAAERPSAMRAIITEAAHVYVDHETVNGIIAAAKAWEEGKLRGLCKYHGDHTETVFKAWSETWLSEWFKHWNVEYLLPSIDAPLLVIQGKNDQYGSFDQPKSISSKTAGTAQMEIVDNCAHIPHLEAQPQIITLMSEFISKVINTNQPP